MNTHRIGIIGFGTIAADVLNALKQDQDFSTEWAVMVRSLERKPSTIPGSVCVFDCLEDLLQWRPDLVIEAAGQEAVSEYVPTLLKKGVRVVVASVGALADTQLRETVIAAALEGNAKLIVPAGAVASLDYLGALQGNESATVIYESRKPPSAWRNELIELGHDPDALTHEVTLFHGSAQEAALRYPKNLNVAATLALAGIGMTRTQVSVVVDPVASGNQHRVRVKSPLGTLETKLMNSPSPGNPKTSWVVAQSVAHAVRKQFSVLVVGG